LVGLGNSGLGASLLLHDVGAIVCATDNCDSEDSRRNARILEERYLNVEIGAHTESFMREAQLIVVSPGVESNSLPLKFAEENNIPIISELELAYSFSKGTIVAVTGTNGKSTVVSLLGAILDCAGRKANVCGNIGKSFSGEVNKIKKGTVIVLEVSSFQLERIRSFRPKISVLLNITDDHLDRHHDMGEYLRFKTRIFENQKTSDFAIVNYDDPNLGQIVKSKSMKACLYYFSRKKKVKGAYLDNNYINIFTNGTKPKKLFELGNTLVKGAHNEENILAASLVANLLGVKKQAIRDGIEGFKPLSHRFEKVATVNGIDFIDDSKATNPDSTRKALLSIDKPCVLIAGGKDKNLSYEQVLPEAKRVVRSVVLIGETKKKMQAAFGSFIKTKEADSLENAVLVAYKNASPGYSVLLSPMCSSFDMFRDYKHRGEVFCEAVRRLEETCDR
jgi:UDP-N-acetylmuramoylalanine--D-glutamate ligase